MRLAKNRLVFFIIFVFIVISEGIAAPSNAVVLMYHRFGESKYPSTNIKIEQFQSQLDFLESKGYQIWPLPRIIHQLQAGKPLPDKTVAITIDDAYASVYQHAFPILQQRNMPFTLFVATNPVDKAYVNYMRWEQIREMAESGVTIGNHTQSHEHLVENKINESFSQWQKRVRDEIVYAANQIKSHTGVETNLLAYPYGEFNIPLSKIARELGYVGFGQQSGAIGETSDLRFLPRFPISEQYADPTEFATKLASLSLPIKSIKPLEPVTRVLVPNLIVETSHPLRNKNRLHCFVSGQGEANIVWRSETVFQVQAKQPINLRRSRYNCTLPSEVAGRYYWYSHLWIRPEIAEP